MKMKHEGYEFELTAEERKTLFFGSRFLVYDSSHRQCYEIIASSNSATLFSSPKNIIISKIARSTTTMYLMVDIPIFQIGCYPSCCLSC